MISLEMKIEASGGRAKMLIVDLHEKIACQPSGWKVFREAELLGCERAVLFRARMNVLV